MNKDNKILLSDKSRGINFNRPYSSLDYTLLADQIYTGKSTLDVKDYDNSFTLEKLESKDTLTTSDILLAPLRVKFGSLEDTKAVAKAVYNIYDITVENALSSHVKNKAGELIKNEGKTIQEANFLKDYETKRLNLNSILSQLSNTENTKELADKLVKLYDDLNSWLIKNTNTYEGIIKNNEKFYDIYMDIPQLVRLSQEKYRTLPLLDRLTIGLNSGIFATDTDIIKSMSGKGIDLKLNKEASSQDRTKTIEKLNGLLANNVATSKLKKLEIKEWSDYLRTGIIPIKGLDSKPSLLYNPELIDPKFREKVDLNQFAFTDPESYILALPQIGTSFGEVTAQVGAMGLGAAVRYAAAKLGAKSIPYVGWALAAGEAAINLGSAAYLRQSETNVEVFDNYVLKVMETALRNGINLDQVLAESADLLLAKGILTDNMSTQDILENAITYGVTTSDEGFERIKRESYAGLTDLEAGNNVLSAWDLAEMSLYSYGGRLAGKSLNELVGKTLSKTKPGEWLVKANKSIDKHIDRGIYNMYKKSKTRALDSNFTKNSYNSIKNQLAKAGFTMASEATEEGIQYLLGNKYMDKVGSTTMNNTSYLTALAKDFNYGTQAWMAALGLHPDKALNDNNELSQSMKIGGFIGLILGGTGNAVTGLQDGIKQLETDLVMRRMAVHDILNKEDDVKVDRWYRAAHLGKIQDVVTEMNNIWDRFQPEGLTKLDIDEDIASANYVQYMYNNPNVEQNLKELSINKGSYDHKIFVKNAMKSISVEKELRKDSSTAIDKLNLQLNKAYEGELFNLFMQNQLDIVANYSGEYDTESEEYQAALDNVVNAEKNKELLKTILQSKSEYQALTSLEEELKSAEKFANEANKNGYNLNSTLISSLRDSVKKRIKLLRKQQKDLKQSGLSEIIPSVENLNEIEKAYKDINILSTLYNLAKNKKLAYVGGFVLRSEQNAQLDLQIKLWNSLSEEEKNSIIQQEQDEANSQGIEPLDLKQIASSFNSKAMQDYTASQGDQKVTQARQYATDMFRKDIESYKQAETTYLMKDEVTVDEQLNTTPPIIEELNGGDKGGEDIQNGSPLQQKEEEELYQEETPEIFTPLPKVQEKDSLIIKSRKLEKEEKELEIEIDADDVFSQEDNMDVNNIINDLGSEEAEANQKGSTTPSNIDKSSLKLIEKEEEEPDTFKDPIQDKLDEISNEDVTTSDDLSPEEVYLEQEGEDLPSEVDINDQSPDETIQDIITTLDPKYSDKIDNPDADNFTKDKDGVYVNGKKVSQLLLELENKLEQEFSDSLSYLDKLNQEAKKKDSVVPKLNGIITPESNLNAWLLGKTMMYDNTSSEPMNIPVALPGVKEIKSGSELGILLGNPKFFKDKKVYFVIGEYRKGLGFDPNNISTYGYASVYMIIQDGDIAYTTAFKHPKDVADRYANKFGNEAIYQANKIVNADDYKGLDYYRDVIYFPKDHSDEEIRIAKAIRAVEDLYTLQKMRNKVVKLYLSKCEKDSDGKYVIPKIALTHVKPTSINTTNGSFNNTKKDGKPVYRKLTDCKTFAIPNDPLKILSDVQFGYGTGAISETPFIIKRIGSGEKIADRGGMSGRLYILPTEENVPSGKTSTPVMISEKFFKDHNVNRYSDIELGKNEYGTFKTFAEYIYNQLVNGGTEILPIIVNAGPKTLLDTGLNPREYQFLIKKTLGYDREKNQFYIALLDRESLLYTVNKFSPETIDKNPLLKKKILFTIMENFHWNTDKEVMTLQPLPEMYRDFAVNNPDKFKNGKLVLYPGELEFTLKDLGIREENGKLVKDLIAPPSIYWMINSGKLMTDANKFAFRDSFIYVDDVVSDENEVQTPIVELKPEPKSPTIPNPTPISDKIESKPVEKIEPKLNTAKLSAAEKISKLGKKDSSQPKVNRYATKEEVESYDKAGLPLRFNPNMFVYIWDENGKLLPLPIASWKAITGNSYTDEFYSTVLNETSGSFVDTDLAKQWLINKLGLTEEQLLIVDPVMKMSINGPAVYGVTRLSVDKLGELFGQIILSKKGKEGIQYHEAWHYVNQILHSELERLIIYNEYVKLNPEYRNATIREVEEALAEDFRRWSLIENSIKPRYIILKAFRRMKLFIKSMIGTSDKLLNNIYNNINKGVYKNYKINEESIKEFQNTYSNKGIYFSIPGVSDDTLAKMPHITNPDVFYNIVDSLTSTLFSNFKIRSADDLESLSTGLIYLKDIIDGNRLFGLTDPENYDLIQEVIDNFGVFLKALVDEIKLLSIKAVQLENDGKQDIDTGSVSAEELWDKVSFEFSKKLNTSFNAKLYFYSIPKMEYNNQKLLIPTNDPIFNMLQTESFDVVWTKLLNNLWDVETWDEIINRSKSLALADPFFGSFYNYVTGENIPDSNTQTQILTTIKSAKNQLMTVEFEWDQELAKKALSPAKNRNVKGKKTNITAAGKWDIKSSDELSMVKRYPREWGKNFFVSGYVDKSAAGIFHTDEKKVLYKTIRLNKIIEDLNILEKLYKKLSEEDIINSINNIKQSLVNELVDLGMQIDLSTIEYLLYGLESTKKLPEIEQFDKLHTLFNDQTIQFSTSLLGNMRKLIEGEPDNNKLKLDKPFIAKNGNFIELLSVAQGRSHPSPAEFSITGADGKTLYPITLNNYMSDRIRWFNKDKLEVSDALSIPYNKHSMLLHASLNGSRLKLNTFVAAKLKDENSSRDYFGVSPTEDYIAKMLFIHMDRITLPTMADKKTWYGIEGVTLFHDMLTKTRRRAVTTQDGNIIEEAYLGEEYRFSNDTLDTFLGYLLDEFDAIQKYYENQASIIEDPASRVDNYHGKIINGKMEPTGNGGYFRYFSSIKVRNNGEIVNIPLNLLLYHWANFDYKYDTNNMINRIKSLRNQLLGNIENARESINLLLQDKVYKEILFLEKKGIIKVKDGDISNVLIPTNILKDYKDKSRELPKDDDSNGSSYAAMYSIIANHVANTFISIEELEKAFVGDPAYYKQKRNKRKPWIVVDRSVDKIKRLGSILSTGDNLRTYWGKGDQRNQTKFTVLHLADNEVVSSQFDILHDKFMSTEVLRYLSKKGNLTQDLMLEMVSGDKIRSTLRTIPSNIKSELEGSVNRLIAAYGLNEKGKGRINQADAAVFIRPALYRKIVESVGEWSTEVEKAFDIMESDKDWLSDPVSYQSAMETLIKPLKMLYFGNHINSSLGLSIPVFDKMAIFPMFKVLAKGDNEYLYNRMNDTELGAIDMMSFESAVKVGGRRKYNTYLDPLNELFNMIDLMKPSTSTVANGTYFEVKDADNSKLATYIQDIRNLRLLMNTDPHEHTDRSLGTLFAKTALSNIIKTRTYGKNKEKVYTGRLLINNIYASINALSDKGAIKFDDKFSNIDNKGNKYLSKEKLSKFLLEQATSSGLSRDVLESFSIDEHTGEIKIPLSAQSNRKFVESRIISTMGKTVIDINTPGGSAIQMPFFGFKKTVKKLNEISRAFNDGKDLNPINKDGSMDCMLSLNFFRHIVPKLYKTDYTSMRGWLLSKNIIGKNADPCALGYRIPTLGLSSTCSLKVTDVLPSTIGDVIVVPSDFTAMTGSDFDIDKLYISIGYYDKDGKYLNCNWNKIESNSEKHLVNGLLDMYRTAISDDSNIDQSKAPLDNLTNKLKSTILKQVLGDTTTEVAPFAELMPSYQSFKKYEYTGGKTGIAPFALAATNHALTQSVNLNMRLNTLLEYELGNISDIEGQDGERILDWLSAMINAHVDVAKDPYIINLNVNNITYNMATFLLRTGKGEDTFYFLSLPILKEFTANAIEQNGIYGVIENLPQDTILESVIDKYLKLADDFIKLELDSDKKKKMSDQLLKLDKTRAFNKEMLIKALSSNRENNITFDFILQQLIVAKAYQNIEPSSSRLSRLINLSLIDTKKYGNTLSQILNYGYSIARFKEIESDMFYVTDDNGEILEDNALDHYYNDTFLNKKLQYAVLLPRKVLRSELITATDQFTYSYNFVVKLVLNPTMGVISKDKAMKVDRVLDDYYRQMTMDSIDTLGLDSGELYDLVTGKNSVPKLIYRLKNAIIKNLDGKYSNYIDGAGNITNEFLNYLYPRLANVLQKKNIDSILTSNSSMTNSSNYENRLMSYFTDIIGSTNSSIKSLANRMIKYSLYTTIDNKNPNSFNHLIPSNYRIDVGYANAIKETISSMNNDLLQVDKNALVDDTDLFAYVSTAYSIARNNTNNEDIVKRIKEPKSNTFNSSLFIKSQKYLFNGQIVDNYLAFPSRRNLGNFVVIQKHVYGKILNLLYVNVGIINMYTEGAPVKGGVHHMYALVPALGTNEQNIKEYYKGINEVSDFSENNLSCITGNQIKRRYSNQNTLRLEVEGIKYGDINIQFNPSMFLTDNFNEYDIDNMKVIVDKQESETPPTVMVNEVDDVESPSARERAKNEMNEKILQTVNQTLKQTDNLQDKVKEEEFELSDDDFTTNDIESDYDKGEALKKCEG